MDTDKVILTTGELQSVWSSTNFGELVRDIRTCDELSQTELANRMGVSKQFLCAIENGTKSPTVRQAVQIANALGYNPRSFIEKALETQLREADLNFEVHLRLPTD